MTFFKELFKSLPRTITKYPVVQKGFHFGDFASKQALKATVWIAPASIIGKLNTLFIYLIILKIYIYHLFFI